MKYNVGTLCVMLLLSQSSMHAAEKSSGAVGSAVVGGVVALVGAKACQLLTGSDAAKSASSDDLATRITALESSQGETTRSVDLLCNFIDRDALGIDTSGAASSSSSSANAISLSDLLQELRTDMSALRAIIGTGRFEGDLKDRDLTNVADLLLKKIFAQDVIRKNKTNELLKSLEARITSLESGASSSSSASSVEQDELIKKSKRENEALRRIIVDLRMEQKSLGKTVSEQSKFITKQGAEISQLRELFERVSDGVLSLADASSSQLAEADEEGKNGDDTE